MIEQSCMSMVYQSFDQPNDFPLNDFESSFIALSSKRQLAVAAEIDDLVAERVHRARAERGELLQRYCNACLTTALFSLALSTVLHTVVSASGLMDERKAPMWSCMILVHILIAGTALAIASYKANRLLTPAFRLQRHCRQLQNLQVAVVQLGSRARDSAVALV